MDELTKIEADILCDDGSCRDVNFLEPTWNGVEKFIEKLEQIFFERSSSDGDGNSLVEPHWKRVKGSVQQTGSVHLIYRNSSETFINLQVFVGSEDDGSAFIELTFFPDDVARVSNLERAFVEWVDAAKITLQARRYFCRYENASWEFGDISQSSGVFFASKDVSIGTHICDRW